MHTFLVFLFLLFNSGLLQAADDDNIALQRTKQEVDKLYEDHADIYDDGIFRVRRQPGRSKSCHNIFYVKEDDAQEGADAQRMAMEEMQETIQAFQNERDFLKEEQELVMKERDRLQEELATEQRKAQDTNQQLHALKELALEIKHNHEIRKLREQQEYACSCAWGILFFYEAYQKGLFDWMPRYKRKIKKMLRNYIHQLKQLSLFDRNLSTSSRRTAKK